MIESGLQLSEYQSRKAFSVYLHCILQRLTDFDPDSGQGSIQQVSLVVRMLNLNTMNKLYPEYYLSEH